MSGFDCTQFQRRLDAGDEPAGDTAAALAHAATCADCASLLAAERAVHALFASAPADATATPAASAPGFTDRVMARVALTSQSRAVAAVHAAPMPAAPAADPLPWWIRVAARREAAAACLLAALAILFAPQLLAFARTAPQWAAALGGTLTLAVATMLAPIAGPIAGRPLVGAGVALAFLPLVALAAHALYLLGMQLARVRLAHAVAPVRRA